MILTDVQRAWRWKLTVAWLTGNEKLKYEGVTHDGADWRFAPHCEIQRACKWARRAMKDEYETVKRLAQIKRDADRLIEEIATAQRAADKLREDVDHTTQRETTIAEIARTKLRIPTLDVQHSDSLDFHDLSVVLIREALLAAYDAGVSTS